MRWFLFALTFFFPAALAQEVVSLAPAAPVLPELPVADFASQVLEAISKFGGLPWVGKIAIIITLVLASMKVSFIRQSVWDKLGQFKAWAAPILGLALGLANLSISGQLSLAGVIAYVSAGAGALILHELLDTVKAIPGLGSGYRSFIDVLMSFLGAKK